MGYLSKVKKPIQNLMDRYPSFGRVVRGLRDYYILTKTPIRTPFGFLFIGNDTMGRGEYEIPTVKLIQQLLDSNQVFINIGANFGYYCCIALSRQVKTLAFEPVHSNLKILYSNIRTNHWQKEIEIYPFALGNREGLVEIFGDNTGASLVKGWAGTSDKRSSTVPVFRLDTLLLDRFKDQDVLILVDIEGAERMLLEGAQKILQRKNVTWIVEITTTENQPAVNNVNPDFGWTFEEFWRYGYICRAISPDLPIITPQIMEQMQTTGKSSFRTYNYLFTHLENRITNTVSGLDI